MSKDERVQLVLDVDPAADPIRGALQDTHGHTVEFAGWLGFAAAIEEALAPARLPVARPRVRPPRPRVSQAIGESSPPAVEPSAPGSSSRE